MKISTRSRTTSTKLPMQVLSTRIQAASSRSAITRKPPNTLVLIMTKTSGFAPISR
ncbi:unnamed protein product [Oikopleura dioica]|uniref:Uncharacterized protein n=1 Tax=Oikopleura dioica TaxID=34765 RepID=E4X559_OIKDI|nr:unnamed protein product [Oikopleura dioica]